MIRPELYKIRHHRTPWVLAAVCALLVLAAPVWLAFKGPESPDVYLSAVSGIFTVAASLLAAVFGAWVIGHEYRQGTLRRVLAVDAGRSKLLAVKATVGLVVLATGLAIIALIGVGGAVASASINGDTVVFGDIWRSFLAGGFVAVVTAAVAFALSVILRSDTYAILGSLAIMVIFGPIMSLIPTVGNYTPYATANQIGTWIITPELEGPIANGAAAATLAGVLVIALFTANTALNHRDV